MADGIYSATSGAVAQEAALEVAAHNLANVATVGFKGHRVSFEDTLAQEPEQLSGSRVHVRAAKVANDFAQGSLRATDGPLDVALQGPGFFVVDAPQGERLTRNGALSQRPDGTLQNNDGLAVQGHGGAIVAPRQARLRIDAQGVVFANDVPVDRLKVVDVGDLQALRREASGLWNAEGQTPHQVDTPVHAGALESSNVNAIQAMTSLIGIQRAYESYHRSMETIKNSEQRLTNQLG